MFFDNSDDQSGDSRVRRKKREIDTVAYSTREDSKCRRSSMFYRPALAGDEFAESKLAYELHDWLAESLSEPTYHRADLFFIESMTGEELASLLHEEHPEGGKSRSTGCRERARLKKRVWSIIVAAVDRAIRLPQDGKEMLRDRLQHFRAAVIAAAMHQELTLVGAGIVDANTWQAVDISFFSEIATPRWQKPMSRLSERMITTYVEEQWKALFDLGGGYLRGWYDEESDHWVLDIARPRPGNAGIALAA